MPRTKQPPATVAGGDATDAIDPLEHVEWAKEIARRVRRKYRFPRGSADQEDLESHAILTLYKRYTKFDFSKVPEDGDVEGAFRGWLYQYITSECAREARRLRGGGTFQSPRAEHAQSVTVKSLGDELIDEELEESVTFVYGSDGEGNAEQEYPPPCAGHSPKKFTRRCSCGRNFRGSEGRSCPSCRPA